MVNNKKSNGGKSNKGKDKAKTIKQSRAPVKVSKPMVDSYVRSYLQMLNDPCSATPVAAPYIGTESGYLVRTVDSVHPSCQYTGTAGASATLDIVHSYVPSLSFNTTSGSPVVAGCANTGSSVSLVVARPSNFCSSGTSVGKYRPVAACLRYIPTGPFASRSGEVGIGYAPDGHIVATADAPKAADILALCQLKAGNGQNPFEIKWLPNNADALWIDLKENAPLSSGGGGIFLVGLGLDGVVAQGGQGAYVNGYVEMTTIWEWLPQQSTGVSMPLKAPNRHTLNDVLSNIKDIGAFVTGMSHSTGGFGMLSSGWKATRRVAQGLLTM